MLRACHGVLIENSKACYMTYIATCIPYAIFRNVVVNIVKIVHWYLTCRYFSSSLLCCHDRVTHDSLRTVSCFSQIVNCQTTINSGEGNQTTSFKLSLNIGKLRTRKEATVTFIFCKRQTTVPEYRYLSFN